MPNLFQRTAAKIFGMPTADELKEAKSSLKFAERQLKRVRKNDVASGVEMNWGQYSTEFNKKFRGDEKWDTLDKMEADPRVKSAQRRHILPLQTAEWEMQPASDSPKDIEVAEFCAANLLRANSDRYDREYWLDTPWKSQRLVEILRFQRDGFSVFAKSHRVVKGKVVFDQLKWIEPHTVTRWIMDSNDILLRLLRDYDEQTGGGYTNKRRYNQPLDAENIKLYAWDMLGARYSGRSAWRSMFGAWYRKDFIQRIAIIWAQKVGAPIPVGHYPKDWNDEQRTQFEEFIQSMMGLEPARAWGAFEFGQDGQKAEVSYAGNEGEPDRSTPLVDMENKELAQGMDTSSSMLGETGTGSRALGTSKGMVDMISVEATVEVLAEQEAHGVGNIMGVIDELVTMNFSGVKELPRLVAPSINIFERLNLVSNVVLPGVAAGLIPNHPDLRRQITELTGFTLPDDAYDEAPEVPEEPEDEKGDDKDDEEKGEPGADTEADAEDLKRAAALRLSQREDFKRKIESLLQPASEGPPLGGSFRKPNVLEATSVNLAEINRVFRVGERDAMSTLRITRRRMLDDLMNRLRKGKISPRTLDTQRRSKFRFQSQAESALKDVLRDTGENGADHVDAEIRSQQLSRRGAA